MADATTNLTSPSAKDDYLCAYVDEFYQIYSSQGRPKAMGKMVKPLDAMLRTPCTFEDAIMIVKIYEEIYQGTYPFKEMLDPEWIHAKFADPNFIWGIFEIEPEPGHSEIVGCFTIVIDFVNNAGYLRGLMVRPKFQKKINVRELASATMWKAYDVSEGKIAKWYCEARTAHNITQYLMKTIGSHIHALFINKDYFYNVKESDALMLAYSSDTLSHHRQVPKELLPEMVPFYEYYQQIYGYAGKPALNEMILNPNTWEINELVNRMHLTTSLDSHGYETILIKDPEDPFTQLTALHTTSVHNIEKIAYSAPSLEAKIALIWMLQIYINMHEIEYCEWWVPSSDLSQIRSLIDYGFGILGYVPAWSPVAADSHVFEDVAILGWSRIPLDRSKLRLIPEGNTFLNIFNTPF
jgi:hypothetical protein